MGVLAGAPSGMSKLCAKTLGVLARLFQRPGQDARRRSGKNGGLFIRDGFVFPGECSLFACRP